MFSQFHDQKIQMERVLINKNEDIYFVSIVEQSQFITFVQKKQINIIMWDLQLKLHVSH